MKKPSMPITTNEMTTDGNYSDEGFQETKGQDDDDGMDEMERIRAAMAKEKTKS